MAIDSRNYDSSIAELTKCLVSVLEWLNGVKLRLSSELITEFIIKHTRESLLPELPVTFLQSYITPAEEVKIPRCYF